MDHYALVGWKSGRSPGPLFDAAWYRGFYNDVDAAGYEPLLHFILYGQHEGRRMCGTDGSIFDAFQSLGENCEFGLVRQHLGSQLLGLFRFASTTIDGLTAVFEVGLTHAISAETVEMAIDAAEYHIAVPAYGMRFHTTVLTHTMSPDAMKAHEVRRLQFLARKFTEDVKDANKILVHSSHERLPRTKIRRLFESLRRSGPIRLLHVTRAGKSSQCGAVNLRRRD